MNRTVSPPVHLHLGKKNPVHVHINPPGAHPKKVRNSDLAEGVRCRELLAISDLCM